MDGADSNVDLAMSFIHSEMPEEIQSNDDNSLTLKEQDRFLPIANVARIMKKGIPKSGKVAKDARECVQECVSEYISFITSEASDRCQQEKRKTINGEDILWAMNALGFENYVEPLKVYLQKYREVNKSEKMETTEGGSFDPEYNNITFTSDQVVHSDISYGTPTTQIQQSYTLG